jgi:hypothetical protein
LNALYFQSEDFSKTASIFSWVSGTAGARPTKRQRPSAKLKIKHRKLPQNSPPVSRGISAKLGSGQKIANRVLTASEETRGRKRRIHAENVVRAANDLFKVLEFCRDQIDWGKLEIAKTEEEVTSEFERVPGPHRERLNLWLPAIPEWAQEGKFPKANLERKMRHLADSVAAEGFLTPRRCRDVCLEERKRQAQLGMILRREFYIECSRGYQGPAKGGGCRQCGTNRLSPEIEV